MTNRRNTIQKDLVKNAVYEMKRHVTANEVYEFLKKEYPTI
jgi:Fur family ferric uptake transcriptional regulator/Fur family peroxide stress response transcriptional regulator